MLAAAGLSIHRKPADTEGASMKAAVFHAVGKPLTIETVPDPKPAANGVIIEVAHCGICGSDLHMTDRAGILGEGTILGHEFAGTIVELGSAAGHGLKIGDRVTALPVQGCNECEMCEARLYALCSSNLFTGCGVAPGAYARYVGARAAMVQRLPGGVDFKEGALVEPLAVAYHGIGLAELRPGASVLILGAGPIGVGTALFARLAGARHVFISEPSEVRRQRALDLGATHGIDPRHEDVAARVAAVTGNAPDVVIECVGIPGTLQQAINLVKKRGRVVVVGVCMEPDTIIPITALGKEASIVFSQCYTPRDFSDVIDFIAQGRAAPKPMVTETVGFSALPERFEALRKPSTQCKVLIDPSVA